MQPHHLEITVGTDGKVEVKVDYRDRVPDLLSAFSPTVRRRAALGLLFPSMYEWKVLLACHGMPRWAEETVRQHLMYERAVRIDAKLKRRADRRRKRAERYEFRKLVREQKRSGKVARRQRQQWGPMIATAAPSPAQEIVTAPPRSVHAGARSQQPEVAVPTSREDASVGIRAEVAPSIPRVGGTRHGAASALGAPLRGKLSVTQRLAQEHGIAPAHPRSARNVQDHGRGR